MPELPEVETVARGLKYLSGRRLGVLEIHDARVWFESEGDPSLLAGLVLREVSRRGKYLLLRFEEGFTLVQHLRMTGKMLSAGSRVVPRDVSERVGQGRGKALQIRCTFRFEDAEIWFFDTRRFGTLTLVRDEEKFFRRKGIAPDPILEPDLALARFLEGLARTEKPMKSALLDQAVVAGVGNIYADEALHAAGLHPLTPASRIREPRPLWEHILRILGESIRQGGSTVRDYVSAEGVRGTFAGEHFVYNRKGEPCQLCGKGIERIVIGGRASHFCPECQPRPRGRAVKARRAKSGLPKAARRPGKPPPARPRKLRQS